MGLFFSNLARTTQVPVYFFAFVAAVLTNVSGVLADEVTGTWTGNFYARGNYYYEKSTRVVAPQFQIELATPTGVRLRGQYLVDAITSASQAAGAVSDVRFTEVRHDVNVGVGKEFTLHGLPFNVDTFARVSKEPDYLSLGGGIAGALSLNQRMTVLSLGMTYVHDEISTIPRGINPTPPAMRVGFLNGIVMSTGWSQVLSPSLTADVSYDFGWLEGHLHNSPTGDAGLANPYRPVIVARNSRAETHPQTRFRHTVQGRLGGYIRASGTTINGIYRTYIDSWDVGALSPELRIYQDVGPFTQLRFRYRYYTQTKSFFYKSANQYVSTDRYVSADPKMSQFYSNLVGVEIFLSPLFLQKTFLKFLAPARLDLSFEYMWRTNRYGNAIISQAGIQIPF